MDIEAHYITMDILDGKNSPRTTATDLDVALNTFGNFLFIQLSQFFVILIHFCSLSLRTLTGKDDSLLYTKENTMLEKQFKVKSRHGNPSVDNCHS